MVALPDETSECVVCQGLLEVFERTGMAPGVVAFDNATGVGHRNADGTAARTRLFSLFCAHYGFEPRFRDPVCVCQIEAVQNGVSIQSETAAGSGPIERKARRHCLFFYPIRAWVRLYDSPSNLIILPWCTVLSTIAVAMFGSPNTRPQTPDSMFVV